MLDLNDRYHVSSAGDTWMCYNLPLCGAARISRTECS